MTNVIIIRDNFSLVIKSYLNFFLRFSYIEYHYAQHFLTRIKSQEIFIFTSLLLLSQNSSIIASENQ